MLSLQAARGCLIGGAIGDALGARVEFQSAAEIRRAHPRGLAEAPFYGSVTDDTQMTLFTLEGLLVARAKGVADVIPSVHQANLRWHRTQTLEYPSNFTPADGWLLRHKALWDRRAPGLTCLGSLEGAGPVPEMASNDSKGCGGVMRVAPVGLAMDAPFETAAAIAGLTHGHPTSSVSAGAFAELVARLARLGEALPEAVDAVIARVKRAGDDDGETFEALSLARDHARLGSGVGVPEVLGPGPQGGGWVAEEALAIAVFACLAESDPVRVLCRAVEHDGDSDSTGAIAGNLLGAWRGEDWVRADWLGRLELRGVMAQMAEDLVESERAPATGDWKARYAN